MSAQRQLAVLSAGGVAVTERPTWPAALLRAVRPHQWIKNVLVFVPLIGAHRFDRVDLWLIGVSTFVAFSLSAAAIYILNDIADIDADRLHPSKRNRPFAAGQLSARFGYVAAALLAFAGFTVAAGVSWAVAATIVCYVAVTIAYTARLKREPVLDVFTLAGLYVIRIAAGGLATSTPLTSWLLAFAMFLFLSLAFVKRYVELVRVDGRLHGRGYGPGDLLWLHAIGTSAGYMAVVVLALYVNAPEVAVLYRRPDVLWILCPVLLFWLTRLWFRAGRQMVQDDPVLEALTDPVSYIVALVAGFVMLASI